MELIVKGHKEIAYVCSTERISDAAERLSGYRAALERSGLPFNENNIFWGEPSEVGGVSAAKSLIRSGRSYTAVATYNDAMASGVIEVFQDSGVNLPHQVSIIGFDNDNISSHLYQKLTTMNYPVSEMAIAAATLALNLELGNDKKQSNGNEYIPNLVSRRSIMNCRV
ncbi:substrate-binding domain-containing protein [Vibrio cholerae]